MCDMRAHQIDGCAREVRTKTAVPELNGSRLHHEQIISDVVLHGSYERLPTPLSIEKRSSTL